MVDPVDWMDFNSNMNNLTALLTGLIAKSPILDQNLMALLDFNITLNSIGMLLQNPDM